MLWIPQKGIKRAQHNLGAVGVSPPGTAVLTGAAAATKGAAVELIAATSFDAFLLQIRANHYGVAGTSSQGMLDIMIGAATEQIVIPDLLFGQAAGNNSGGFRMWEFPIYIPSGSRITAAACGNRTSANVYVSVYLVGGDCAPPWKVGTRVTTYGVGTRPSGISITPGASGAEGSWTEIAAATTRDHFAVLPGFQVGLDTATLDRYYFVDLGVGAAAAEEEIMESYLYGVDGNEQATGSFPAFPHFQDIPSGTRLSMRVSNSGTNDAAYNAVIHALS